MSLEKYGCRNGAYHTGFCCETCWNRHPEAKPDESFLHSKKREQIEYWMRRNEFVEGALMVKFTEEQSLFLFNKINRY